LAHTPVLFGRQVVLINDPLGDLANALGHCLVLPGVRLVAIE
jgi:hypothetical protein